MKPNTPPSYAQIFEIWKGTTNGAGFTPGATYTTRAGNTLAPFMPPHRGLYISTGSAGFTCTFNNIDGTTASVKFATNSEIILPIIIKGYSNPEPLNLSTGGYINGLL